MAVATCLVVVTWNVLAEAYLRKYAYAYPGVRIAAEERRASVVSRVARLCAAADVVLLQEVDVALLAALAERGLRFGYFPRPPDKPDGLAWWAAPSCPPERTALAGYSARHGGGERLARGWVRLDLRVADRRVAVVGTHMDPDLRQSRGGAQAKELLDELAARPADVAVVLGDLNGGPGDGARVALADAGFMEATTDDGRVPDTALLHGRRGWSTRALDAVLVRGGTATLDPVASPSPPIPDAAFPSDHLPLRATVVCEPPRSGEGSGVGRLPRAD